nr:hypothetical protein [Bacillus alveayuensis]
MIKKAIKHLLHEMLNSRYHKKIHKHYSSSGYMKHSSHLPNKYGHHFYKRKHRSSGFFSSFYSS